MSPDQKRNIYKQRQVCKEAPKCPEGHVLGGPDSCYECVECQGGQVPDKSGTRCVDVIATCTCTQRYKDRSMKECIECGAGEIRDPHKITKCIK